MDRIAGTGAAGGLGGAFKAYLDASLESGIDIILESTGFDRIIHDATLVITGEGKIDGQTAKGKVVAGITAAAHKKNIPVIAIAGIVDMSEEELQRSGLAACFQIGPTPENESDLEYAMRPEVASKRISETVAKALVSLSPSLFRENLL